MSSRRSFFRRALGACGALVGIRAAVPAIAHETLKGYTVVVMFSSGAIMRVPDVVKVWQGTSEFRPSHTPDGEPCLVSDLVSLCDTIHGTRHTINMRDVVSLAYERWT